jgi:hypothetical protein
MNKDVNFKADFILSEYWELIYHAYSNISFSPERRANSLVVDYSEELLEDLKELGEKAGNYQEKYINRFTSWMSAKGRCISSMITGPANFPVRRAEKANRSESNRYEDFRTWRSKYFTAVNRVKTPSPEDDLELVYNKLDTCIILSENVKEWNKIIRKYRSDKIDREQMFSTLREMGINDQYLKMVYSYINESYWRGFGTMSPEIRRLKDRAEDLKRRIETKDNWEDIIFDGGRISVEDDRVKIFHDERPEPEVISKLKSNGFRWSRYWGCWCRKHTRQALLVAERLVMPVEA